MEYTLRKLGHWRESHGKIWIDETMFLAAAVNAQHLGKGDALVIYSQ